METLLTLFFGLAPDYENLIQSVMGIVTISAIGGTSALFLTHFARKFDTNPEPVIEKINQLLPQTQCAQCGYPGCLPYAEAIASGEAINLCPPGGQETVEALAILLGRSQTVLENDTRLAPRTIARIREAECIGCTLCLPVCPVDAIIGAPQLMHSVIEQTCTGCDLCLEPCPVDCIDMVTVPGADWIPVTDQRKDHPVTETVTECIRCDACESRCPKDLAPQALYWAKDSLEQLTDLDLQDCIECKLCDRVCPANLPLTQIFVDAKQRVEQKNSEFEAAENLQARFSKHQSRELNRRNKLRSRPGKSDRTAVLKSLLGGTVSGATSGASSDSSGPPAEEPK